MTDDLMVRLARILQAETIDLRELAGIAGADPAHFYVGTSLEGVDIRGQDLRGMKLPGLDLEKVRKDDATQVDEPEVEVAGAGALVFSVFHDLGVRTILETSFALAVFGSDEQEAFLSLARNSAGPILLMAPVADLTGLFGVVEALERSGRPYLCLAIELYSARFRPQLQIPIYGLLQRVVVVQGNVRQGRVSGEARDLVVLLLSEWQTVLQTLPTHVSVFVSRTGLEPRPRLDAAARILEEAVFRGLGVGRSIAFVPPDYRGHALQADDLPWEEVLDAIDIVGLHTSKRYDLAVFLPVGRGGASLTAYATTVAHALAARGWSGGGVEGDGDDENVRLKLPIARRETAIEVLAPRKTSVLAGVPKSRDSFLEYTFSRGTTVCLMPEADLGRVVQLLITEGVLLVNARDLLAARPNAETLWAFVGAQLARVMEGGRRADRAPYIRLLLSTALSVQAVEHSEISLFHRLVSGQLDADDFRFKVAAYRQEDGGAVRAELGIFTPLVDGRSDLLAHAFILIDDGGVAIAEAPPPRAEYRSSLHRRAD